MKHVSKAIIPIVAIFFLAACNNKAGHENHSGEVAQPTIQEQKKTGTVTTSIVLNNSLLNAIYRSYEALTDALIKADIAGAKTAANAIEAGAREMKGAEAIINPAARILEAKDIEAQRTAYSGLSNALISLVKNNGVSEGELYVEFCSMAFNDKGGYWLSASPEIRNPYFGDKMMKCGEITDTIR